MAFLTGCAGARVVHRDADFTWASLRSGKLAVAAVSGLGKDELLPVALSEDVRRSLAARPLPVEVMPLEEVRRLVPTNAYLAVLRDVSGKTGLAYQDVRPFDAVTGRARYLLWIHLSELTDGAGDHSEEITECRWDYNAESKRNEWRQEIVGYRKTRDTSIRVGTILWIYDLERGRFVWVAEGAGSASNHAESSGWHWNTPPPEWPQRPGLYPAMAASALRALKKIPQR